MRNVVYAIAVLAAAGIVYLISEREPNAQPAKSAVPSSVTGETLVVHVPAMHCPFGCYPAVQKTLAGQPGVKGVELAKQADPNAIDNPRVLVTLASGTDAFNQGDALAALASAGFAKSTIESTP